MHLQESGEMYLETLYILSMKDEAVRPLDVATYMGFSKPSVTRGMHILKDNGYVESDKDGHLHLTEKGLAVARETYERHTLLTKYFVHLGVPEDIAAADACKIEHDISDVTFEAIKKHAGCKGIK